MELVGLADTCEARHGIGLRQNGVLIQLAASQRIHSEHRKRQGVWGQADREMLGLKGRIGGTQFRQRREQQGGQGEELFHIGSFDTSICRQPRR
jgi:hypothetical protein